MLIVLRSIIDFFALQLDPASVHEQASVHVQSGSVCEFCSSQY
jgi:hypothetical protein